MRERSSKAPWLILAAVGLVLLVARDWSPNVSEVAIPADLAAQAAEVDTLLVKFGAEWCGPCRRLDAELEQVAADLPANARIVMVDVDQDRTWADAFGVGGIPHMVLFKNGAPVEQKVGYRAAADVAAWMGLP